MTLTVGARTKEGKGGGEGECRIKVVIDQRLASRGHGSKKLIKS